jgi:HD-GYP domain-containing protein (c-di-GMP phosphodiesterase class II)
LSKIVGFKKKTGLDLKIISLLAMSHISIRVSTLRGDQPIDFDSFVKINDKHILYLRKGDSFEGSRLKRLKEKKLKKMYILDSEEKLYRDYLQKNIDMAFDSKSTKTIENRSEIVQGVQQANTEEVMENPENEVAYNQAKDSAAKFVNFLNQESNALGHILKIDNPDANIAHHGVTVSSLSVALAKKLGFTDPKQTQMLSLGALLHDFEHFHSGIIIQRKLDAFSPDELATYKKHPLSGAQRVQDKKHFDQTVLNIISQHEEYIDGKGYPQGLAENKLDPMSIIVGVCNAIDRMITFEGMDKKDVIKNLMINGVGKYPLKHIQMLGEILKEQGV